jgi:2'-5' RNA ligase
MARTRTFIAVNIGPEIRHAAAALQQDLTAVSPAARWVEPESLHITLAFLGDVNDREIPALCATVAAAVKPLPPFTLAVAGLGAFPTPRRPKTIWAGITEGRDELIAIQAALIEPLESLGVYRREDRGFTPHLTLGRIKSEEGDSPLAGEIPKRAAWTAGRADVSDVIIYGSERRRTGPEYTVLGRAALRGRKARRETLPESAN